MSKPVLRIAVLVCLAFGITGCPERSASQRSSEVQAPAASRDPSSKQPENAKEAVGGTSQEERLVLRARHPLGVPLHPEAHDPRVSGRLPDAASVRLLSVDDDGNWMLVQTSDGSKKGWIVSRYVASRGSRASADGARATRAARDGALQKEAEDLLSGSPSATLSACRKALSRVPPSKDRAKVRVVSWNVRWFPDGKPGRKRAKAGTDLDWMACHLALLDADVVALQEFKTLPRAKQSLDELLEKVGQVTSRRYVSYFDDCPRGATQHVGMLVDSTRVSVQNASTVGQLNPHGEACKDSLRPGLAVDVKLPSGDPARIVSLHLKSGTGRRSFELRKETWERMARYVQAAEVPLLFAGDFNTMGCPRCSPSVSAGDELAALSQQLRRAGLDLLEVEPACSHYFRGKAGLLDGFALSRTFAPGNDDPPTARAGGPCAALECADAPFNRLGYARELSDHCPLLLDLPQPP